MLEKHSAANNPALVFAITAEIKALRDLGRTDEADKLQKRLESLSASQANPN
jgi:hypothetical protein